MKQNKIDNRRPAISYETVLEWWDKFPIDYVIMGGKQLDPVREFFSIFRDNMLSTLNQYNAVMGESHGNK